MNTNENAATVADPPQATASAPSPHHCPKCGKLKLKRDGSPHACKAVGPPPGSAVDAALNYAAYAADWMLAESGAAMWASKFGSRAKGDDILGRLQTETRPDACLRILAAEVLRLRSALQNPTVEQYQFFQKEAFKPLQKIKHTPAEITAGLHL